MDQISTQERAALSVAQVAQSLGVSIPQIYKLINARELLTFTIGKRRLVSHQAIEQYVRSREAQSRLPSQGA